MSIRDISSLTYLMKTGLSHTAISACINRILLCVLEVKSFILEKTNFLWTFFVLFLGTFIYYFCRCEDEMQTKCELFQQLGLLAVLTKSAINWGPLRNHWAMRKNSKINHIQENFIISDSVGQKIAQHVELFRFQLFEFFSS